IASPHIDVVHVWDAKTGKQVWTFEGQLSVWAVAFSHDSKYLASSAHDSTVRIWNVDTGKEERSYVMKTKGASFRSVAFSPDDVNLAIGSSDGVRIWDIHGEPVDR